MSDLLTRAAAAHQPLQSPAQEVIFETPSDGSHASTRWIEAEIKSRDLLKGKGVSIHALAVMRDAGWTPVSARGAGRQFYRDALDHIATITEVRILVVGLGTPHAFEAYRLWFWLAYAALVERERSPRPRLPLAVIDGEDAAIRSAHDLVAYRFYRSFGGVRYYIGHRRAWFVGGSVHQDSALLPFVQAADLVAAAARHAIKMRKGIGSWYETHLRKHALSRGREIDVSQSALSLLRKLDPMDKCGSGHFDAIVPP